MRLGRGLRGGGHNGNFFIDFFHVSEHVDHFKAIKVFSLKKKTERVWCFTKPPDQTFPVISVFFLRKFLNCFKMIYML